MGFHPAEPFLLQFPLNRTLSHALAHSLWVQLNVITSKKLSRPSVSSIWTPVFQLPVCYSTEQLIYISVCITKTFPFWRAKLRNSINSCVFQCFNLSGQRLSFLQLLDKRPLEGHQLNLKAFKKMFSRILIEQVWRAGGEGRIKVSEKLPVTFLSNQLYDISSKQGHEF